MLAHVSESEGTFSLRASALGAAANQGLIFVPLKPYSQRKGKEHTATAIVNRVRPMLFGVSGAIVFATAAAGDSGVRAVWRLPFVVQDLAAQAGRAQHDGGLMRDAASRKELVRAVHAVYGERSAIW